MPRYRTQLMGEDGRPYDPRVHVFDYNEEDKSSRSYRKQLLAVDSCIYLRGRTLAQEVRKEPSQAMGGAKASSGDVGKPEGQSQAPEGGDKGTETWFDAREDVEGVATSEGTAREKRRWASECEEELNKGVVNLEPGQEFEGYIYKCPNGPYDYALKLWEPGKRAVAADGYPKKDVEVPALIIDREGDYLTLACGPNIAYATRKSFLIAGVDPDDLSLPFDRLRVTLTKAETRPKEVPAAAWVAHPTQVNVAPFDIY